MAITREEEPACPMRTSPTLTSEIGIIPLRSSST
eukprot:CAMPEP_0206511924 /NCGR_PEP_ID=MMETSP0324_2-20121206/60554_1 /ASSEMBLY_ACC=CAM_ASM_000836 /TAXON_ID=2866 /ORGANISM="Crypthecodinium cohnii, Strain Seligo" /LENGTH=33 /DNA_ID= /DNA_START= /DNA_END= /DNA_ORIENTATION=